MKKVAMLVIMALVASTLWAGSTPEEDDSVTLVVWDQFNAENTNAAIEAIQANFLERYPNVTIERTSMEVAQMSDTLRPALQSGSGPDVFFSETGIGFVGPILQAGYIMDLTDVWEDRGWNDKLFSMSRDIPTVDGVTYAVGHQLEFVPIYYNKSIFDELNLDIPETIADMEAAAEKIRDAGYIAMSWGGLNWWPQANTTTTALWAWLGPDFVMDAMFEGASWESPETIDAMETVWVDWTQRGFFPENAEAIDYDGMLNFFYRGEAGMLLTGSWMVGGLEANVDSFEVGSFLWPPARAEMGSNTVAFVGSSYMVNANSEHPEVALDYVDFVMADPESARIWYEVADTIPPLKDGISLDAWDVNPLTRETFDALTTGEVTVTAGLALFTPPEVQTFINSSAVQLITRQITPDEWMEEFQKLWDEAREEGLTIDTFKF